MLNDELREKLSQTLAICSLHHQRMMFAYDSLKAYWPLTESKFSQVSPIELALFDQLIYRFSKLQDSMGARLFKQVLEALEEDSTGLPFIDILQKMEKLNLIERAADWVALRQTRNTVSHEYPFFMEIQVEELNLLPDDVLKLTSIWLKLKDYIQTRFAISFGDAG